MGLGTVRTGINTVSTEEYRLHAMVTDPDITTRMRLKEATTAVPQFSEVVQRNSLDEALSQLNSNERCDVVFISYKYDPDEVKAFVLKARESKQGQDCAYVLVLKSKDQDSSTVASSVVVGIDGFLFEPYSVESLVEITELSRRVRQERSTARAKLAMSLGLTEATEQLDLIAFLRSCGAEASRSMERFREICTNLSQSATQSIGAYYELAVKKFTDTSAPKSFLKVKKYGGVSARVRKRIEEKVRSEIEARKLDQGQERSKKDSS